jgi:gamma-butyrobetaine dioxygenase
MKLCNKRTLLEVSWPDGSTHQFHPVWLRELSFEESAKDPATGHRLYEAAYLPLDLEIRSAETVDGAAVGLEFSDGHHCRLELHDLRRATEHLLPDDLVGRRRLWQRDSWHGRWRELADIASGPSGLLEFFDDLATSGVALVRGLPIEPDGLRCLTDLIGPIRETNWGRIADIRSIKNGYDLSMTDRALEPHVDNPYRLPQPGYIFLHCLQNDAAGGESVLIDGFNVANTLQRDAPQHFETLCAMPVVFGYRDDEAILEHYGHLIERRPDGQLARVIFHNRSDQVPARSVESLDAYYAARRAYADLIWSPEMQVTFKLEPGDAYVVDNYRILHGRAAFNLDTGARYLRQCYMDRDIVSSRQKVMIRRIAADAALRSSSRSTLGLDPRGAPGSTAQSQGR